jgi:phage-related protein
VVAFIIGEGVIRVTLNSAGVAAKLGAITSAAGAAGAALAALPGLGASVAGIGGVLAGAFSGVGDALKGYQADQKAATKTGAASASAAKAHARQIRDAQQAVDDARRNAARVARDSAERVQDAMRDEARTARDVADAIEDAKENQARIAERGAEQMADASERVQDAMEDERRAQESLTDARAEAARQLEDLAEKVSDYALNEEGALIAVERARERLAETEADSSASALDLRDARHDLAVAEERLSDLQRERARDTAELREAEAKGVEGSDKVTAAREKLSEAEEKVRDAQEEAARTQREVARANAEAAEKVAEAVTQGQERMADAERATARARQDAAEAQQDANRAVTDALESLADAQASANEGTSAGAAATSAYADAMAKLLPSQREFVKQLISMAPLVDRLKAASADSFLPGLTQMLKDSEGLFPTFETHLRKTGEIMGDTARRFGELFKSDAFKTNLQTMLDSSLPITQAIGDSMVKIFDRFVQFGAEMAPVSEGVAYFITAVSDGFVGMLDVLAPHAETFKSIWISLGDIFKILLPVVGELVQAFATSLAPALAGIAVGLQVIAPLLPALVAGFLGLLGAVKVINTLIGVWKLLQLAFTLSPWGLAIAGLVGLVTALVTAYQTSETFRSIVDAVFKWIGEAGVWLWQNALKPAFDGIVAAFQAVGAFLSTVWTNVIRPTWDAVAAATTWLWQNILVPAFNGIKVAFQAVGDFFRWVWDAIIRPTWDALGVGIRFVIDMVKQSWEGWKIALRAVGDFFGWVWNSLIKPAWDALGNGIRWVIDNVVHPVFNGLKTGLQGISNAFTSTVDWIRTKWDQIREAARAPVQWVIDVVYNRGIRPVWNGIADVFGLGKLNEIRLAGGGVLPGYAPGIDSVPALLSPGEAVLVPELVKAIGPQNILAANRAASGRKPGARGRFAGGGIVGGITSFATDLFTKGPIDAVKGLFSGIMGDSRGTPGGGWVRHAMVELPVRVMNAIIDKAKSFVAGLFGGGIGGGTGPGGWQWQMNVLRGAFPGLALISGFRPGAITATGNPSYHGKGRAVDVPPRMDVFNWIKATFGANTKELIFSPAGGGQIWNGRPHMYTGVTRANHWDHVHWAYDTGGMLPSGMTAHNASGRPERVLSPSQTAAFERLVDWLDANGGGGQRRGVEQVHVHLEQTSGSAAETGRFVALAMRGVG